ncbi:AI-2E family transporter [Halobacteriaceae archaeon GCM10025711]
MPRNISLPDVNRGRAVLWFVAVLLVAGLAYVTWSYVGTIVLGVFAYYVTRPVFARINARIRSRTIATAVALLLVTVPVLLLVVWTLGVAIQQLSIILQSEAVTAALEPFIDVTEITNTITVTVEGVVRDPASLTRGPLADTLTNAADIVSESFGFIVNIGLHAFIAIVVTFFLLRDDYRIVRWADNVFVRDNEVLLAYFKAVDTDLKSIFYGSILNALLTAALAVVTYSLLNLVAPSGLDIPSPGLVGLLVGVGSLVPVVGIKIVWVPIALYLLAVAALSTPTAIWFVVVFALVSVVVVDTIPDQVLRPYVSGRNLNVGAVMLAYIFGPLLFGWYGIFLGPLLLAVGYEFARIVLPWLVDADWVPELGPFVETEPEEEPAAAPPAAEAVEDVPDQPEDADGDQTGAAQ